MGFKRSEKRNRLYETGKNHRRWLAGDRSAKQCAACGSDFAKKSTESIRTFWKRKFCCKVCADKGGFRYSGKDHPNYRDDARRRNRNGPVARWVRAVLSRDNAMCRKCGIRGVELHAHHIKSWKDFPDLRFDVSNGVTLCFKCHWEIHTAQNEKAVNSVDTRPVKAEGNTEPSSHGNVLEGVTTRGQAYRRWQGLCKECSTFVTKRLSDTTGKRNIFCSRRCAGIFNAKNRTIEHRLHISMANSGKKHSKETRERMSVSQRNRRAMAVISSKSAAPEREEIV